MRAKRPSGVLSPSSTHAAPSNRRTDDAGTTPASHSFTDTRNASAHGPGPERRSCPATFYSDGLCQCEVDVFEGVLRLRDGEHIGAGCHEGPGDGWRRDVEVLVIDSVQRPTEN